MSSVTRAPLQGSPTMLRARLINATSPVRIVYGARFECTVGPDAPVIEVTEAEWEDILKPLGLFTLEQEA